MRAGAVRSANTVTASRPRILDHGRDVVRPLFDERGFPIIDPVRAADTSAIEQHDPTEGSQSVDEPPDDRFLEHHLERIVVADGEHDRVIQVAVAIDDGVSDVPVAGAGIAHLGHRSPTTFHSAGTVSVPICGPTTRTPRSDVVL